MGDPLRIETDILVRSMGPVLETEMSYSMQCYLRQRWHDERLKFNLENITKVTLSTAFLKYIWKPNTYFLNGRRSTQHNITTPNVFVRISADGSIYMSRRITIRASCPMKLMNYPMDRPVCPLIIGGYGYTTKDVLYIWKVGAVPSPVEVYNDLTMSQFDMDFIQSMNFTESNHMGEFSILAVDFHLERHLGFFILQTYLPCTLIVCLSWVSFWINRDAAPARVLLGMTTILSTAAIGMLQRDGLPRVPYATALDVYLYVCLVYNLAAMIQYAAVNSFTKIVAATKPHQERNEEETQDMLTTPHRLILPDHQGNGRVTTSILGYKSNTQYHCLVNFWRCIVGSYRAQKTGRSDQNSVSKIDLTSRLLFPGSFGLFHIFYWSWYLGTRL
ncbi:gamma-aminobutyric acid receptor alpha-like [Mizuhopecten yessoensis]|uniref:gamma-aminobutyric acid receptor alpha-like n=1 Tax=Mizuhopecten yessoensis TaxID=6573 RepID=UPI000B45770B|nr:gamma-aminobutyric acid receptor alpha-like [Mizuhopecten yessoensis]